MTDLYHAKVEIADHDSSIPHRREYTFDNPRDLFIFETGVREIPGVTFIGWDSFNTVSGARALEVVKWLASQE